MLTKFAKTGIDTDRQTASGRKGRMKDEKQYPAVNPAVPPDDRTNARDQETTWTTIPNTICPIDKSASTRKRSTSSPSREGASVPYIPSGMW
jgi:hypothetical protein